MGALLASLTTRARSVMAAGASAAFCGLVLAERDLIRVGFLLAALPLVGALIVGRARVTITSSRSVSQERVAVGAPLEVQLRVTNTGMLPVAGLMLEDRIPASPRDSPQERRARFSLGTMRSGKTTDIVYPVPPLARGRVELGPLRLRMTDPFGLVEMVRPFASVSHVVIVPEIHALGAQPLPGGQEELGGSSIHAIGALGADDLTVREYRQGDDVRKIHWRSSARTGELMVRQEERPWQGDVIILVDSRRRAHRGEGARSSLEWIVSAAASIAQHLDRRGYRVTIVSGGFAREWPSIGGAETLADLQLSTDAHFGAGAAAWTGATGPATLVALIGAPNGPRSAQPDPGSSAALDERQLRLPAEDVDALNAVPAQARLLIALDTSTWAAPGDAAPAASAPRRAAPPATTSLRELAANGWHVCAATREDQIPAVWSTLLATPGYALAPS